jgi:hypothetical protein
MTEHCCVSRQRLRNSHSSLLIRIMLDGPVPSVPHKKTRSIPVFSLRSTITALDPPTLKNTAALSAAPFDPTVVGYQPTWGRQHYVGYRVRPHCPLHRGGCVLLCSRLVARQDSRTRSVGRARRCTRSTGAASTGAAGSTGSRAGSACTSPTYSSAVAARRRGMAGLVGRSTRGRGR